MRITLFLIILLMTACSTTHTWNEDKGYKNDPLLQEYVDMVGENYQTYRNPNEYFKYKNLIPVVFTQGSYQEHIVGICWKSYDIQERRIEINQLWFKKAYDGNKSYIVDSYKTRDRFYEDLSYEEWVRYRGIEMALSFCLHEEGQRDVYKTISL